ncbi:iron chelate uptake ABC transporter family permease subunit [Vagococcus salmoninarum]|uniref:Iron ABC transporter permease n=1 Tax=Vagococcus salmoninarum TaxID=2739 RepID=A0A429ZSM7_9ENTE|nr:iron chelate uptake ABC transporter family permease subunit [Vagococcus salmoninarum]MBE9388731.1 iron chelate uptake ABC transporter family permease subunit [Vagococcus salmoninarum]RST96687.1 iron ABC transporter permease [Vagococcus salmoninarum]
MKKNLTSQRSKLLILLVAVLVIAWLFLTYQTYGNWEFALKLRGKKLLAFVFVGIATSFSTITFQTITHNHFLTPSILGFDSLYILIQTSLFFLLGSQFGQVLGNHLVMFGINVILMVTLSTVLFFFLLKKGEHNLYLLLMIGMILGTFFSSASTFLQVLLDPNEYDKLQGKLFASFGNVDVSLVAVAGVVMLVVVTFLWQSAHKLDVLHLGAEKAKNLGIDVSKFQISLLIAVSILVALSTALVGPVTFLGFIVANLTYQFLGTFRHRSLFVGSSLLGIFLLIVGQFFVEQVFKWNTTMSVVIEFIGGLYFISKILRERQAGR